MRSVNKKIPAVLAVVIVLIILLSFAFSKETVHTYKAVVTTQGDCVTPGVRTFRCVNCSLTHTEPITGGHTYADSLVVTAEGKKYIARKCTVCGDELTADISSSGDGDPFSLSCADVSGVDSVYMYTGQSIEPEPVVADLNGVPLVPGTDYSISYENNVEAGMAAVKIAGVGNYINSCEIQFRIAEMRWEDGEDGNKYFYDPDMATGFREIQGEGYFFSEDGAMQTGWQLIDGGYYCFDRLTGKMARKTRVDGIRVDENGLAEESDYNEYKIETMMKAHQIMLEQTSPKDSMEDKRLKLFNWEMKEHGYHRWRLLDYIYDTSPDWEMTFANDIFDNESGCCVSDACAAAFLFREIGYTDIYVCHDTSHCWFTVGDRLYDPLFAEAKSFEENYNAVCSDYRVNPAGRRRIDGVGTED